MVDDAAGTVVTQFQLALDHGGGALSGLHHDVSSFLEEAVALAIFFDVGTFSLIFGHLRQQERLGVTTLCADELGDGLHLRRVDEGALQTH